MRQYSRSNSSNYKKYHIDAPHSILQKRMSSELSKQQKIKSPIFQHRLNFSGARIFNQKIANQKLYTQLYKSADVAHFIDKQKDSQGADEQEDKNANYAYIRQIQALQGRKFARRNFYRPIKADKSTEKSSNVDLSSQKHKFMNNLDQIQVKQLTKNLNNQQNLQLNQAQIEELHYFMVKTHQKCKEKYKKSN